MFSDFQLHPRLQAVLTEQELLIPTQVQVEAIPPVMDGKDIQVCAETGSGKTLAYLLPLMHRLLRNKPHPDAGTRALIMVPTRELADQVFKTAREFCKVNDLEAGMVCGGAEFKYQAALFRKNPDIIVATPGRLVDHLKRDSCDLSQLEILVLDEADRMMDMGFVEDMQLITQACSSQHQTLLLSATLRHEGVSRLVKQLLHEPVRVTTQAVNEQHELIRQQRILADDDAHKDRLLVWLLANESYDKAIVFVNRRDDVERLSGFLRRHRDGVAQLHGEMTQDERRYVMQLLRDGRRTILVATDVAARGLDVEGIDLVVNYSLARKGDEYVHRIGRTGRAGSTGTAISLIAPNEWNLKASIERYLKIELEPRKIEGLIGNYRGPKKLKASGKAAGTRTRKKPSAARKSARPGRKPTTKPAARRKPSVEHRGNLMDGDGFAPIKKKQNSKPESDS
ncbi:MAG: RNA helicase [Oceanospirillaceae bacterium]|nr:RNA helicase [Oceanospirillaceae bacterium]